MGVGGLPWEWKQLKTEGFPGSRDTACPGVAATVTCVGTGGETLALSLGKSRRSCRGQILKSIG